MFFYLITLQNPSKPSKPLQNDGFTCGRRIRPRPSKHLGLLKVVSKLPLQPSNNHPTTIQRPSKPCDWWVCFKLSCPKPNYTKCYFSLLKIGIRQRWSLTFGIGNLQGFSLCQRCSRQCIQNHVQHPAEGPETRKMVQRSCFAEHPERNDTYTLFPTASGIGY